MANRTRWLEDLDENERLHDVCLIQPVRVKALLDAVEAEEVIDTSMLASNHPALVAHDAAVYSKGRDDGKSAGIRATLLKTLVSRSLIDGNDEQVETRINACTDKALWMRWFERALNAQRMENIFGDSSRLRPVWDVKAPARPSSCQSANRMAA